MRLQTLYKSILESLDVHADDVGLLSYRRADGQVERINVSVEGHSKRLVLPTQELLRKGLPDEVVAFHPLSEISNRGESEVFRKLKLLVSLRLTTVLASLLGGLVELAADKERRKGVPPKLLSMLEALPHADQKLIDNMESLISASLSGGQNRLLNIYLKRGGKHLGEKHARVAVVSFPILAALEDPDRKVHGVQLRAKDIPQIKALFEWILPNSDQTGTYNSCSDSMDAPYFEALMRAYARVAKQLNSIQKIASKYLPDSGSLKTDLDWLTDLDELDQLRFEIPPLDGNKGISLSGTRDEDETPTPKSGLDTLKSRLSEAEPVRTSGPASEPKLAPRRTIQDAPASSINTGYSSEEQRRAREQSAIRPITVVGTGYESPRPSSSGGRATMAELRAAAGNAPTPFGMQPAQPAGGFNSGWGQPAPSWNQQGMANHRPNAFATVNLQAHHASQPSGWGSGWSNNSRW